jgi:hypothetical protein
MSLSHFISKITLSSLPSLTRFQITILVNNVSKCTSSANYVMSSSGGVTAQDKSFEVIQSYTPCAEVQVKKGDKVTLETYYDLSKHQL